MGFSGPNWTQTEANATIVKHCDVNGCKNWYAYRNVSKPKETNGWLITDKQVLCPTHRGEI